LRTVLKVCRLRRGGQLIDFVLYIITGDEIWIENAGKLYDEETNLKNGYDSDPIAPDGLSA